MPIKNIIFDVGNVFIYWAPEKLFKRYFKTDDALRKFFEEVDFKRMVKETDRGMPFRKSIDLAIERAPEHKEPLLAYDAEWERTLHGEVDGTKDLAKRLKKAGYKTYILSNFNAEKFEACSQIYGFTKHMDGCVVSAHVREVKPEEPIYKILLQNYKLKPEECVFMDDRQENLDTAERLGFKTILFTETGKAEKELRSLGVKF